MSSYVMTELRGKIGVATDTEPLVYEASIDASEISALTIAVICTAVSGGVNVGNPATVGIEHSFDDGKTWVALGSLNGGVVTGAGTFLTSVTLNTGLVAPIIKVTITAPAGESITVSRVAKNRFLPGTLISFAGTSFLGGSAVTANNSFKYGPGGVYADTFAIWDTTTAASNRGVPGITLAGQGLGALDVGGGVTSALTRRVTLATDHGLASEATLSALEGKVDVNLSTRASEATLSALNGKVTADIGAPAAAVRVVESGLSKAETPIRRDCSTANLNTGSWTEILASSASANTEMHFYNGTGYSIQLAFGAGGAEVLQYIVPPGGEIVRLLVPNATRISLQPYVNITDGEIVINFLK